MVAFIRVGFLVTFLLSLAACGGSGGGNAAAAPNNDSACSEPSCDRENPVPSPLLCGGIQGATCPQGYHCVDDAADDCDPATGADCGGICVLGTSLPSCGGFGGLACKEGYVCIDDPNDSCDGGPAIDCPGICTPDTRLECDDDADCPQLDAMCAFCADGQISCPASRCEDGSCLIVVEACPPAPPCGGIAGRPCGPGFECVDDPGDLCEPGRGDADCGGVCVPASEPMPCHGFAGETCPPDFVCVDDPDDDCHPDASGADCPGLCEPNRQECAADSDCPQLRAPCSVCADGTSACPSSTCERGVCNVSFPTCPPTVTCGDDAEPCKPGHRCVDDPKDGCDPAGPDAPCPGICVGEGGPRPCGGAAGDTCPPGFECFQDTPDGCMPDPSGTDCGGICQPIDVPRCESADECPHILAPCTQCPGGTFACPIALCRDGVCGAAFESCPDPAFCGGIAGFPCPDGSTCIDDPGDDCDPRNGGADCGGICVRQELPRPCGGIAGDTCPRGHECVDVPADDCDPEQAGADCPGMCRPAPSEDCKADSDCPQIGAPCLMCPDGAAACPRSFCERGTCQAIFETCEEER